MPVAAIRLHKLQQLRIEFGRVRHVHECGIKRIKRSNGWNHSVLYEVFDAEYVHDDWERFLESLGTRITLSMLFSSIACLTNTTKTRRVYQDWRQKSWIHDWDRRWRRVVNATLAPIFSFIFLAVFKVNFTRLISDYPFENMDADSIGLSLHK